MDWIKKYRDVLITLGVFVFFGILILLTSIFFKGNNTSKPLPTIEQEAKIELPALQQNGTADITGDAELHQTNSFFLRPSPTELLTKLEGLSYQEFKKEAQNLPGLRIMWPTYFFSVAKVENGMALVMLDASKDGFGVVLQTEIDVAQYPEILEKKQGEKIWIAAEIIGVDPTGTGAFSLKTEYVRFDDYTPQAKSSPQPLQKQ